MIKWIWLVKRNRRVRLSLYREGQLPEIGTAWGSSAAPINMPKDNEALARKVRVDVVIATQSGI
jgi:hypothetical protein